MLSEAGEGLVSRWLSSLLVTVYLIVPLAAGEPLLVVEAAFFCLFAWCCVWFPGAMGGLNVFKIRVTPDPSPTTVWFVGWILLLIPTIVFFLLWVQGVFKYSW